jgi:type II secretory pathway component PulF
MTINRLAKVIEPIMLVFIGLIVVVIATWVFGLILQIMEWAWM